MIKLPKEVSNIINDLETKGIKAYCAGDCVRFALSGAEPLDWDIIIDAPISNVEGMFEGAEKLEGKDNVLRLDFGDKSKDIVDAEKAMINPDHAREAMEAEAKDYIIADIIALDDVENFLSKQKFTISAMADSTSHGFIDPYNGRDDISKKLVRIIGDPNEVFKAEPILMLKAITLVSELGYDLAKNTYEAIVANADRLPSAGIDAIREEFLTLMGADNAGKALRMLAACQLLPYILGPSVDKLGGREIKDMEELADNLHKTLNVAERRIGLFYLCLGKKRARAAVKYLNYDEVMTQHFMDVIDHIVDLHFIGKPEALMDFLARYGLERYTYMHNVAKAQVNVYGSPDNRVQGRIYMYREIVSLKKPVYIEDLAVTGEDLVKAGIVPDNPEKIRDMLLMLTDVVHRHPKMNTEKQLMDKAKYFKKHKLGAKLRNVEWMK